MSYLDWAPGNATCRGQGLSEWGAWERPPTRCCKDRKKELQGQTSQNVFIGLILRAGGGHVSDSGHVWRGGRVCDRLPDRHRAAQVQGAWRGECWGLAPAQLGAQC